LLPVVDAVTVMSGSPLDPVGASTLITKSRSKYVYLRAMKRRSSGRRSCRRITTTYSTVRPEPRPSGAESPAERCGLPPSTSGSGREPSRGDIPYPAGGRRVGFRRTPGGSTSAERTDGRRAVRVLRTEDPVSRDTRRHALAHGRLIDEEGLPARTDELQERVVNELRQDLVVPAYSHTAPFAGLPSSRPSLVSSSRLSGCPSCPT
jgi:hypothetical protein